MADDSNDEKGGAEADLPVVLGPSPNLFAPHKYLRKLLALDSSDTLLTRIFAMLAALCDPMTQPEDNDKFPLSVESLGQVALLLSYHILLSERKQSSDESSEPNWLAFEHPEVASLRFTISLKFFTILQAINKVLRADDELRVRYLQNNCEDWQKSAHHWLPSVPLPGSRDPDACLKLLYYISCVAIMGLYKLFFPEDGAVYSAALNPYTEYFLRLWKTHTSIIALALEMDRELEEEAWATKSEYLDTPDLVKRALLGSSAVRTVLAWILEHIYAGAPLKDSELLNFDISKSPLLLFYDPLVRTASNCGCITRDQQLVMIATLILRLRVPLSPVVAESLPLPKSDFPIFDAQDYEFRIANRMSALGSAGDLMVDLYYHDEFDEDIKYVFGFYESDDESVSENENDKASDDGKEKYGTAKRAKKDGIEFDEEGRDWRDCARGENVNFTERFLDVETKSRLLGVDSDHFFSSWFELEQSFVFLALVKIESVSAFVQRVGQVTINTVAKAIKDEMNKSDGEYISPSKIYLHLTSVAKKELRAAAPEELPNVLCNKHTMFDLLLFRNPECALSICDELFMCKGLRRSLIWYLTRCVDYLITLINYVYELVSGLRGNSSGREAKYTFSRKGSLELSQVEALMALHELFGTAGRWAIVDADKALVAEQNTIKLVLCLCLMILRLLLNGIIKQNTDDAFEDYSHDLQAFLFPWVGRIPEARELFFRIKLDLYRRREFYDAVANEKKAEETERALPVSETASLDIHEVLKMIENLDHSEYSQLLKRQPVQFAFLDFSLRLFYHICRVYNVRNVDLESMETPGSAQEDFYIFLTRFNDFAKNDLFMQTLFSSLEGISVGERPEQKYNEEAEPTDPEMKVTDMFFIPKSELIESEFNDEFLNGKGKFKDDKQEKAEEKKKKKKKKKRRGKR